MSKKNALAILGSPHTNKTTAAMLNFAVHKAEQAGYAVTKITLYIIFLNTNMCIHASPATGAERKFLFIQINFRYSITRLSSFMDCPI